MPDPLLEGSEKLSSKKDRSALANETAGRQERGGKDRHNDHHGWNGISVFYYGTLTMTASNDHRGGGVWDVDTGGTGHTGGKCSSTPHAPRCSKMLDLFCLFTKSFSYTLLL